MESLVDAKQVSVHFDCVDVPDHFCFCIWDHSPQVLEKASGHLFVQVVQVRLDLSLTMLNYLHNISSILAHILSEGKILTHIFALVELDIT